MCSYILSYPKAEKQTFKRGANSFYVHVINLERLPLIGKVNLYLKFQFTLTKSFNDASFSDFIKI